MPQRNRVESALEIARIIAGDVSLLTHGDSHGQGFLVRVPTRWLEENAESWPGRVEDQIEYLIHRELIPEFNRFPRKPWEPGVRRD